MESKIKTIKDAFEYLKYDIDTCMPNVDNVPERHRPWLSVQLPLVVVAEALNTEWGLANGLKKAWEPDWSQIQINQNMLYGLK